jgi:maltokinase
LLSVKFNFDDLPDNLTHLPFEPHREFIKSARWFQHKTGKIKSIKIIDRVLIDRSPNVMVLLLLCGIESTDSMETTDYSYYHLPIIATRGEHQEIEGIRISRLQFLDGTGEIIDAVNTLNYVNAIYTMLEKEISLSGQRGVFRFTKLPGDKPIAATQLSDQHSHSVTLVKRDDVVKTFRRLERGMNVDLEIAIKLATYGRFHHIPVTFGFISYINDHGQEYTLTLFQKFVSNEGDAWKYTLDWLASYYQSWHAQLKSGVIARTVIAQEAVELTLPYLELAQKLGEIIADLHHQLSLIPDPNFQNEEISTADLELWYHQMQKKTNKAITTVEGHLPQLNHELKQLAENFLVAAPNIKKSFQQLTYIGPALGKKCRIHQDLHLGQILKTKNDFVILDFEGEPAKRLIARNIKHSPLKDLAGMVRSFSYAAYSSLANFANRLKVEGEYLNEQKYANLTQAGRCWSEIVSQTFIQAYRRRAAMNGSGLIPEDETHFKIALAVYALAKAVYEVMYEINNRPGWLHIPLAGIADCLQNIKEAGEPQ